MMLQASRASTRVCQGPTVHSTALSFAPRNSFSRRNRSVLVRAEWGAPVDFSSVKVASNKTVFSGMHSVFLNVGSAIASTYTKPGQYIQVKVGADDKPGYFAIASAPGALDAGTVELLIKSLPGSAAEAITALGEGSTLLCSAAQGKGFQLEKIPAAEVDTILMFATGTGVVPLKAVIESGLLGAKDRKHMRLFYGTKCKDSTTYQELFQGWEAAGVTVTQVFSGDKQRYVQAAFEEELKAGLLAKGAGSKVAALLVGQKDMCESVTTMLTDAGVDKDRILMNY